MNSLLEAQCMSRRWLVVFPVYLTSESSSRDCHKGRLKGSVRISRLRAGPRTDRQYETEGIVDDNFLLVVPAPLIQ